MMTTIAQWLEDTLRIPGFRQLVPMRLELKQERFIKDVTELSGTLSGIGPVTGWLLLTGKVVRLQEEPLPTGAIPLSGEWFSVKHHFVLEQTEGGWTLYEFELEEAAAEQATHLAERIRHRHVGAVSHEALLYWRLWEPDVVDSAPICRLALFSGFQEAAE